ncbi:SDR family oxidoreductase [Promicromonospora sp. NPDC023805]|uniref:SDR family NAD(P)-dependent oxidoreductase n=1 Tax=Promicromonospora sp. NPDC023805 TaxID=3154696 RepID=UPI0033F572BC
MKILVVGADGAVAGALIVALAESGHEIVATYSEEVAGENRGAVESKPGVTFVELDCADSSAVDAFAREYMGFDGAVYANMYFQMEDLGSFDVAQWNLSLAHNLTAPMQLFSGYPSLLNDGASIAIVTSTEAFRGSFRAAAYAATKAAAHNLVMTLANNLGARGIRANAVAPGWIGGVMDTDEVFKMSRGITPLGRLGSPSEVADVIEFLLSPKAGFVSGSVITVDGGYTGVDTISKFEAESTPEGD